MIYCKAVKDFKIKTPKGVIEIKRGQTIKIAESQTQKLAGMIKPLPYIDNGTLIIPFGSDPKYHWWNRGQSIRGILRELGASDEILKKYKSPYSEN